MLESNPKRVSGDTRSDSTQKADENTTNKTGKKSPNTSKDFKELMTDKQESESMPTPQFPTPHFIMAKALEEDVSIKSKVEMQQTLGDALTRPTNELKHTTSLFSNMTAVGQTSRAGELKIVVDQLIDQLYIMRNAGQTETTLTLKHPPLFAGAVVTITEYSTAPKQVNITFENLRPEARELVDRQSVQIKEGLKDTGYTVHMLRATEQTREALVNVEEQFRRFQDHGGFQQKREEAEQEDEEENKKV